MTAIIPPVPTLTRLRDHGEALWLVPVGPFAHAGIVGTWLDASGNEIGAQWQACRRFPYAPNSVLAVQEEWRVVGWQETDATVIEFRDGTVHTIDNECDEYEGWCMSMQIQSGDDCEKAGWIIEPDSECYVHPERGSDCDPPTRWRPAEWLPEFACRMTVKVAEVRTPVQLYKMEHDEQARLGCHLSYAAWIWPILLELKRKTDANA